MRIRTDYTGMIFGSVEVIGRNEVPGKYKVRCSNCGRVASKPESSIRAVKNKDNQPMGCNACKGTYSRKRGPNAKPVAHRNNKPTYDIGVIWTEQGHHKSTHLGMMQQDFYLGRKLCQP